ncbi:acyltransferase family protein [Cryptosporangium aurantiacum]|uniref:Peptidoglycan/LPS O-acetylase OafA/YrhL, contains acyltransferase and SGNH-hydrolase domains n=1 Tax=Cryptosporangium aurantiacum TaxID=134849 RepID=A0A1M7IF59_9ACTN|nr:acyltransferase [Cryptosporangium aurantiacum]SHM39223.1 Peptidoglycan/LPS O-acetylase OafA/YrhL, contains acyltransferase and SGNH-hydrolase domains [Cryptosporangium aurantiacum]
MTAPAPRAGTRAGGHLDVLDGVRALAAFAVVATHAGFQTGRAVEGFFAPFLARLDFGVTLFFLLSGFLLYRPFVEAAVDLRPRPESKAFLLRRFARIFPAYWALLALTMLIRPWEHSTGFTIQRTTWTDWLEYATLTHIYFGDNPHQALTHIWSLVVEMSFYLALPLIAAVSLKGRRPRRIMRRQTIALGVLLAIGPLWGLVIHQIPVLRDQLALQWLPAYLDWFALGMILACLPSAASVGAWPRLRKLAEDLATAPGTCWIIAGILFALSMTPVAGPYTLEAATTSQWIAKHLLYGATAFFMLLPLVSPAPAGGRTHPLRAVLTDKRVRWLGEISYGVFLFHLVLMFTLVEALNLELFRGGFSTLFPLTVAAAIVVAALSYRLLERPAQNYVRRRTRRGAADIQAKDAAPATDPTPTPSDAEAPQFPAPDPDAPRSPLPPPPEPAVPWEYQHPVQLGPWVPQQPTTPDAEAERSTEPIPRMPPPPDNSLPVGLPPGGAPPVGPPPVGPPPGWPAPPPRRPAD